MPRTGSEEASPAISPRMSICVKGTNKDIAAAIGDIDFDDLTDESAELSCDSGKVGDLAFASTRSKNSSSSILLTGTSFSILSSSTEVSSRRRREKNSVQFSTNVYVRNHTHVTELTEKEKLAAWFSNLEYRKIYKNNLKIIHTIGVREKERKKLASRKKKEKNKQKRWSFSLRKNDAELCSRSEDSFSSTPYDSSEFDLCDDEIDLSEQVDVINRDEEQGYSIRGLENETNKRRRKRDDVYARAKLAVLALQADVDAHMEIMQDEYDQKVKEIEKRSKSKRKGRHSSKDMTAENHENVSALTESARSQFAKYARNQYNNMVNVMAERYGNICKQHAEDALNRGLEDERVSKAIDRIEVASKENGNNSSLVKGAIEPPDGKRRPSVSDTVETEEILIMGPEEMDSPKHKTISTKVSTSKEVTSINPASNRVRKAKKLLSKIF